MTLDAGAAAFIWVTNAYGPSTLAIAMQSVGSDQAQGKVEPNPRSVRLIECTSAKVYQSNCKVVNIKKHK